MPVDLITENDPSSIAGKESVDGSTVNGDFRGEADAEEDRLLLARLRGHEMPALALVMRKYETPMKRAAYLYLGNMADAEDVLQNTFVAVWDAAKRTSLRTRLRPWLFAVMFNQCRKLRRSWLRSRRRDQAAHDQRMAELGGNRPDPGCAERIRRLREALSRLPDLYREAVIMRYERGMNQAEMAEALSTAEGTVKSRLSRGISMLRMLMEGGAKGGES